MKLSELQEYLGVDKTTAGDVAAVCAESNTRKASKSKVSTAKVVRPKATLKEKMIEINMAKNLGYFLCKCTWPPQIMVLTQSDFVYKCPSCARVRDL